MATSNHEMKNQLHVFHNPFSKATTQPKIPDGKVNDSLGFSTQFVGEIQNKASANTLHVLMFAGANCAIVVDNSAQATLGTRVYYCPGFSGSSAIDWEDAVSAAAAMQVKNGDDYALWRVVSCGLQLKLLNPTEEDDGWWESVRVVVESDAKDWALTTVNNSTNNREDGTLAPLGVLTKVLTGGISEGLEETTLSNLPSYNTGLLRDLHRYQFELHGCTDFHDFIHKRDELHIPAEAIDNVDIVTNYEANFEKGFDDIHELIRDAIDTSYDMAYIRLHCRANTGTSPFLGSRFHMNCVSNQEIHFDHSKREARFQTKTGNAGAGAAGVHASARRGQQNSANQQF